MSIQIDIRTVFFADAIALTVVAVCFLIVALSRKVYRGFGRWTAATFIFDVGLVLIGLRGVLPASLTIVVANGVILVAVALVYDGMAAFCDRPPRRLLYLLPGLAWLLLFLFFTYVHPNTQIRTVILLSVSLWFAAFIMTLHFRRIHLQYGYNWMLSLGFIVMSLVVVLRLVYTIVAAGSADTLMGEDLLQGVFLMTTFAAGLFISIGLLVLNVQRTERDLEGSTAEVKTLQGIIPICVSCKRIRDDDGFWNAVDTYVEQHTDAEFSHGLCPECMDRLYPDYVPKEE